MGKMLPVTEIHGKMLNEIHGIDFTKLDDFLTKLSYEFSNNFILFIIDRFLLYPKKFKSLTELNHLWEQYKLK
jgi:hypothetical protein